MWLAISGIFYNETWVMKFKTKLKVFTLFSKEKIVNGLQAVPHEFPSIASLYFKPVKHFFCGGTISKFKKINVYFRGLPINKRAFFALFSSHRRLSVSVALPY